MIRNFLIYIAVLWIIIAFIYFSYSIIQYRTTETKKHFKTIESSIISIKKTNENDIGKSDTDERSIAQIKSQTLKRIAIWFLIIGGGLTFNAVSFLQPAETEIMSRIYMIAALLWLIGTMVILYYVLRLEEARKKKMAESIDIEKQKSKLKLKESENLIIGFAVVAAILAVNGLTIQHRESIGQFTELGQIILFLAALWLGISIAFLYISFRSRIVTSRIARDIKQAPTESKKYGIVIEKVKSFSMPERIFTYNWPMFLTVVAVILGVNSIVFRYGTEIVGAYSELLSRFLVVISLLWLFGSFIFLFNVLKNTELADEIRRLHGIYQGKIEYTDKMDKRSKMLFSNKFALRGKPDYIVKIKEKYIPVEIKTGKVPRGPHFSHILQIAAYCLLINENYKIRPPYGIISYGKTNKHKINYDDQLENLLIEKIDELRQCIKNNTAHRNHKRKGKCTYCSRNEQCPEKL
jgi:CRISPR-associated exonuclease Cas4